jgi:hypothetical protein
VAREVGGEVGRPRPRHQVHRQVETIIMLIILINLLMPVQQNGFTHVRVLSIITDLSILA